MPRLKSKGPLQKQIDDHLVSWPIMFARRLIDEKLKAANIHDDVLAELLTRMARGERSPSLEEQISARLKQDVQLEFDEADRARIKRFGDELVAGMPALVTKIAETASDRMLEQYKESWAEFRAQEIERSKEFKRDLRSRWAAGLDSLRMLLQMSHDIGKEFSQAQLVEPRRRPKYRAQALAALHVRACQVTAEVICLIENGFADGAIARWRTLHEISVIATLLGDGDEKLAERYLAHTAVEQKRSLDAFETSQTLLGGDPLPLRDKRETLDAYDRALKKYGADFSGHFGWAAGYFKGNKNPKFVHLQEAAGRAAMQTDYKTASYNIHASASALFHSLGAPLGQRTLAAGASNAGFTEPGRYTAFSLVQITAQLWDDDWDVDQIARAMTLTRLRDEISAAFEGAEEKLRKNETIVAARRQAAVVRQLNLKGRSKRAKKR